MQNCFPPILIFFSCETCADNLFIDFWKKQRANFKKIYKRSKYCSEPN